MGVRFVTGFAGERVVTGQVSKPITQLLDAVGRGDESAHEQLWLLIYEELHRIARSQMAAERDARTLQPLRAGLGIVEAT